MSENAVQKPSDGNTSFLRAARAGNLDKVLEHLKNNIDINTCNANGLNALHLASKDGHVHVVSELLKRGAIVDSATKKGNTALHIASLAGQEDVVKLLLQHNASVNVQSQNGFTPLYMAAQENHDSVVKLLLANGANQSLATEDGFTPLAVAMQQGHDKVVAVLLESDTRGKVRLPALHIAAKKDDVKAATLLLENDHNPDVTSKSGFTPLHIASHYGNEAIANLLIQKGADVNYAAKHNITPLHVAAKWGKTNMVSLLLEKGANIESKTRDGLTPLHCAARSGHEQVVDMLLERGAPISAKTKNGLAPLHMAAQGEHVDAARILLYHRAPVDEVTVDYLTALHVAAHCGHVRVAKLLLDRNADANARALNGFTPLHIACKKNRIKVVELLLRHGASISATTESGLTPLHVASFMGCMNIVIYLLQHDASPDVPTVRGETPLHLAARANQTDIIRILLRNGAQVDARAREQQTPLHIASRLGNVDIVMLLLQHGAQVDATTKDMYTALHIAAKEGQDEVAAVLIENGASLDATTKKGFTPLHLTAKYGHMKVAQLLLQKDAPVDAQGKNGVTPLHVASHYDHQNVALLLLEKGASPHATAKNGHTPLHIAARKNQMDIATTLLEYGAHADAESKAGFTPLHLSAQEGHTDMSALLLEHKAECDHQARNGLTPLHLCAQEDKVNVAEVLVKNGGNIEMTTKAGYTPLHVASHFGQANMVRFLLQNGANVDAATGIGYTPLHQAAQQGHCHIVNLLLEHKANANAQTASGQTPLHIARKLGYISVLDSLKSITNESTSPTQPLDEKYRVVAPEAMHETFMSDSEEEGGEDTVLSDQPYRYLTVDEMKSLGDDSLPIDVTRDERVDSNRMVQSADSTGHTPTIIESVITPQRAQVHATTKSVPDGLYTVDNVIVDKQPQHVGRKLQWKNFLVSFLVDARGGAMRGCRHSGVRIIVPARSASQPTRITCRYVKPQRTMHPPQLMEGEALASRVLEIGPVSTKFLGPVVMEVPHFASLRGKEREIVILRSDNGETWREHTIENSEELIHDVLNECFEPEEINQLDELGGGRICRFVTYDFPQYFAVVSRIRQEVHAIGPEGGMVSSTVVPQVQAVFPQGALTKKIKVGLQAQPIDPDLTAKLLGRGVAVSPIVTVEPRRRKFHKAITLSMPAPKAHSQGMINQYSGNAPTLRLLCSITGGPSRAQWEDVTGSTPLTFVNDCVSFTTTVSARFWLMDCRNISEATKMATELYREAIHVPFMAKFVVFSKRVEQNEARLRVFCMTDDKEDKTLEQQEHFTEVAKSRDVEVLEGKSQFIEMAGNLIPVTKSGEQLQLTFRAFRENRLPFSVRVKDQHADTVGRTLFMREPKVAKGEPPQQPICILNIVLPEKIIPDQISLSDSREILSKVEISILSKRPEDYYLGDMRIVDISNLLGEDWVSLAPEIGITPTEVSTIQAQNPTSTAQQAQSMLRLFKLKKSNDLNVLENGLRAIGRNDIIQRCIKITSYIETSRQDPLERKRMTLDSAFDEADIMKDSESVEELVLQEDRKRRERDEIKYSAEEKAIEESESDDENVKRSVAERRTKIEKRLSLERAIPASTQKKEIVQEITEIKRKSLIEDKKAIHEEEIMLQMPTDNIIKSAVVPDHIIKLKTNKIETPDVSKTEFDKELHDKFKKAVKVLDEEEIIEETSKIIYDSTVTEKESKQLPDGQTYEKLTEVRTVEISHAIPESVIALEKKIADAITDEEVKTTTEVKPESFDNGGTLVIEAKIIKETITKEAKKEMPTSISKEIIDPDLERKLSIQKEKIEQSEKVVKSMSVESDSPKSEVHVKKEPLNILTKELSKEIPKIDKPKEKPPKEEELEIEVSTEEVKKEPKKEVKKDVPEKDKVEIKEEIVKEEKTKKTEVKIQESKIPEFKKEQIKPKEDKITVKETIEKIEERDGTKKEVKETKTTVVKEHTVKETKIKEPSRIPVHVSIKKKEEPLKQSDDHKGKEEVKNASEEKKQPPTTTITAEEIKSEDTTAIEDYVPKSYHEKPRESLTEEEFYKSVQATITKKMSEGLIEITQDVLSSVSKEIPESQTPPPTPIEAQSQKDGRYESPGSIMEEVTAGTKVVFEGQPTLFEPDEEPSGDTARSETEIPKPTPRISKTLPSDIIQVQEEILKKSELQKEAKSPAKDDAIVEDVDFKQSKKFWESLESAQSESQSIPVPKPRSQLKTADSLKGDESISSVKSLKGDESLASLKSSSHDSKISSEQQVEYSETSSLHTSLEEDKHKEDDSVMSDDRIEDETYPDLDKIHKKPVDEDDGVKRHGDHEDDDDALSGEKQASFYIGESSSNIITKSTTDKRHEFAFDNKGYEETFDEDRDTCRATLKDEEISIVPQATPRHIDKTEIEETAETAIVKDTIVHVTVETPKKEDEGVIKETFPKDTAEVVEIGECEKSPTRIFRQDSETRNDILECETFLEREKTYSTERESVDFKKESIEAVDEIVDTTTEIPISGIVDKFIAEEQVASSRVLSHQKETPKSQTHNIQVEEIQAKYSTIETIPQYVKEEKYTSSFEKFSSEEGTTAQKIDTTESEFLKTENLVSKQIHEAIIEDHRDHTIQHTYFEEQVIPFPQEALRERIPSHTVAVVESQVTKQEHKKVEEKSELSSKTMHTTEIVGDGSLEHVTEHEIRLSAEEVGEDRSRIDGDKLSYTIVESEVSKTIKHDEYSKTHTTETHGKQITEETHKVLHKTEEKSKETTTLVGEQPGEVKVKFEPKLDLNLDKSELELSEKSFSKTTKYEESISTAEPKPVLSPVKAFKGFTALQESKEGFKKTLLIEPSQVDQSIVEQTLEEVKESLDAVQEELIEVVKDGKLIKESPSEFEFKMLPHIKSTADTIQESFQEEATASSTTEQIKDHPKPDTLEEKITKFEEAASLSSADDSSKLEVIHRIRKETKTDSLNRWSVQDLDQSSSGDTSSQYQSFEKSDSRPLSSDIENLLHSSDYQTAQDASLLPESTEYISAVSTLDHSGKTISSHESMKSFDSESSANLGSIEVSEMSETLVPSTAEGDVEEDLDADDSDRFCGVLMEDFKQDDEPIASQMKRSQEMTFIHEPLEHEFTKDEDDFQSYPKLSTSIEDSRLEEMKFPSSLEEGSILSMSLSSASAIDTVIENVEDLAGSLGASSLAGIHALIRDDYTGTSFEEPSKTEKIDSMVMTTTRGVEDDTNYVSTQITTTVVPTESSDAEPKRKGHKRSDSSAFGTTDFLKGIEIAKAKGGDSLEEEEEEVKEITQFKEEKKESESESDYDAYESEYSRAYKTPSTQKKSKEKRVETFEKDQEPEKRPFTPSQSVSEPIIEDVSEEAEPIFEDFERRPSQNMQNYCNIPDITITEDLKKYTDDGEEIPDEPEHEDDFKDTVLYKVKTEEDLPKADDAPLHYAREHEYAMKEDQLQDLIQREFESKTADVTKFSREEEEKADSPDSFEMLEQPDISDEFVIIEEVAKEANEFDTEGKSISIKNIKYIKKHDEEVEQILVKSAPAAPNEGSILYREDLNFEFEESPPTGQEEEGNEATDAAAINKRWVEMQLSDNASHLRYPYEIGGGILEDIKEEDTEFEVGSSRISSFKDSFSSTPEYDVLAGRKYFARGEHDDVSMSSLQEFESLEQAISLENRKMHHQGHQGSQDSLSNGSFTRRYMLRTGGQGDDVSLSSLKEFEGLENACIEAHLIEIKAKEEAALLLSRSDESNKSNTSNGETKSSVTKTVTTVTTVTQAQSGPSEKPFPKTPQEIEALIKAKLEECEEETSNLMEVSSDSLELGMKKSKSSNGDGIAKSSEHGSCDSLEINKSGDIMTSSIDSFEISKDATARSSRSDVDSLEQQLLQNVRRDSVDSIELEQALQLPRTETDVVETSKDQKTTITTTTVITQGPSQLVTRTVTTTSSLSTGPDYQKEMIKDISSDSLNLKTDPEQLLTSTESLDHTSSTATNATYQNENDSLMSGSMTSCGSTTMIDTLDSTFAEIYQGGSSSSQFLYEETRSQIRTQSRDGEKRYEYFEIFEKDLEKLDTSQSKPGGDASPEPKKDDQKK